MNMMTKVEAAPEQDGAREARAATPSWWRRAGWGALPVVAIAAVWGVLDREGPAVAAMPVPTVQVAQPLVRQVNEWDDYVGRFEASRSVEVRPRVGGAITAVHFTDGAIVRRGQLLFTIDPRPYAAALAEARASVASASSDLALARANLARAGRLVADDAVSKSDLDQLGARVRAASAGLAAAQARVQARALDMEFTRVRAPIAGRISDRRIDAGNLVTAGDTSGTLLTTINALDPIYFAFDASEGLFLKSKRAGAEGTEVQVRLQDEAGYARTGRLDFTDNGLDPRSGTVRGRAVLDNPDLFLTPGMFGNMRLASGQAATALLVPDAAVQTDQARKTVLTVARDGTVVPRPVVLGPVVDGLRIVRSGLTRADRVVVSGTQMAMPGAKVQVQPGRITPSRAAAPPTAVATAGEATFAR
ncbi:efflux RND transporter periplasmic adaptor subunit [Sphingomonas corticis]|jgi:RND family efflux transporter MFP subunit|uniref:Efflux RND transporter periplasmic adaptor subunit n=1 Tax=Sphingomonas corticis TaxID=2722791 RepID=A0ABX1CQC2_9SPHN|nr:efflux RND transporter periplasmic adaptor subunit [Sphingomonas corticis]NJR78505.1 efflux RND transporter periplasmic adaptor subunit [Sphingomonas corticis]